MPSTKSCPGFELPEHQIKPTVDESIEAALLWLTYVQKDWGKVLALTGRLSLLRVHSLGTGFGGPADRLEGEVVIRLDSAPGTVFGLELRRDSDVATNRAMFDVLRSAYADSSTVRVEFLPTGAHSGRLLRVIQISN